MSGLAGIYGLTFGSMIALAYFALNHERLTGSKVPNNMGFRQVAFRDPKLIADHQQLLQQENARSERRGAAGAGAGV